MKAIGYARVSTQEQTEDGISLDAQASSIRAYAKLRGLQLVEVVVDAGVSGGTPLGERPGGLKVLNAIKAKTGGASAVVATKLDRLFRNVIDCLTVTGIWDDQGAALHLIDMGGQSIDTSSAMGRFFLTMMAGLAEMERMQIRERTASAMQHLVKTGAHTGGSPPYGLKLDDDGELQEVKSEQKIVEDALRMKTKGMSLRAIARALTERGLVSRSGVPFQGVQVRAMVTTSVRRTLALRDHPTKKSRGRK